MIDYLFAEVQDCNNNLNRKFVKASIQLGKTLLTLYYVASQTLMCYIHMSKVKSDSNPSEAVLNDLGVANWPT